MKKKELEVLLEQIKNIILNKPFVVCEEKPNDDFAKVQQAVAYLAQCLTESNQFLSEVAAGNLAATPPDRKNFLATGIKELHAGLKHLAWQANQVALGDYNQKVSFLGEFSESFNKMTAQLKEREEKLKQQSQVLEQSNELMKSVMDNLNESIVVLSQDNHEIVYLNRAAKILLLGNHDVVKLGSSATVCKCENGCPMLKEKLTQSAPTETKHLSEVYGCDDSKRYFHVETFSLQWNGMHTYANRIVDVTEEYKEMSEIKNIANTDELTGLYNRRYCTGKTEKLLEEHCAFTICLIDADKLKYANDTFGHAAGDTYLKTIAQELLKVSRASDAVCRLGGDEFAVIFVNCNAELVLKKLTNVNEKLESMALDFPMAISFGAVYVSETSNIDSKTLIEKADTLMYEQKKMKREAQSSD